MCGTIEDHKPTCAWVTDDDRPMICDCGYVDKFDAMRKEMFEKIDAFIMGYYGPRCSVVQGGCSECAAWAVRDALNATLCE